MTVQQKAYLHTFQQRQHDKHLSLCMRSRIKAEMNEKHPLETL